VFTAFLLQIREPRDAASSILSDGLVARRRQSLQPSLFFLGAQPLLHSLAGGIGKFLGGGFYELIRVLVGCVTEKTNLLPVTTTPLAKAKMNPKTDALENGKLVIKGLRLKSACLPATG
jgi:hypothetical protein